MTSDPGDHYHQESVHASESGGQDKSEESPRESVRFLQITDVHSLNKIAPLHGSGRVTARLSTVVDMAAAMDPPPDAVLLTGDLVDRSNGLGYDEVLEFSELLEAVVSSPVIAMMGNHDDRTKFDAVFGVHPRSDIRRDMDLHDHVRDIHGVRLVVVDSSIPHRSYGELSDEQLQWISDVVAKPAPLGTILAMHHPPVLSPMPQLRFSGLRNAGLLAEALAGSDVRAIVAGHFHHASASWWMNRLVWCGPGLSYTQDVLAETPRIRGWNHGYLSLLDVGADVITASVVEIPDVQEEPVLDYQLDLAEKENQWDEVHQNLIR